MLESVVQLSIMVVCRITAISVQDGFKIGTLLDSDGAPRHNRQMQRSDKTGVNTNRMVLWLGIVFYGGLRNRCFDGWAKCNGKYSEDVL